MREKRETHETPRRIQTVRERNISENRRGLGSIWLKVLNDGFPKGVLSPHRSATSDGESGTMQGLAWYDYFDAESGLR
jgi:hypothetical protein